MSISSLDQLKNSIETDITPADFQVDLVVDDIIKNNPSSEDSVPMDVVFVGAGPAGLSGAIELAKLVKEDNENGGNLGDVEIAVLEKAQKIGDHSISGAIVNPMPFKELFPHLEIKDFPFMAPVTNESIFALSKTSAFRLPTPPTMKNKGNFIASISEIVRWLAEKAEKAGINILPGFPVESLLVEGEKVTGVRTTPSGLDRTGKPKDVFESGTDVLAKITVLTEGSRGFLTQAYHKWQGIVSENPQIFALGVKEIWKVKKVPDKIIHTMGWPLNGDTFGGSFFYPLSNGHLAIGLVAGLDSPDADLDVHELLQRLKQHKIFSAYLDEGEMVEWGAKTIPEGGYYSIPKQLSGDGILFSGDCIGFVDVPSLKGIHYAMQSGIYAARTAFNALKTGDISHSNLKQYDAMIAGSYIMSDLYKTRNVRLAYKNGFFSGSIKAAMMVLSGGRYPSGKIKIKSDSESKRTYQSKNPLNPDGKLTFSKVDSVFKSGNMTRDDIPSHLDASKNIPSDVAEMYSHLCPAGVYSLDDKNNLVINPPNCVDCKATDVLGPRWAPREGGSGIRHKLM